MKLRLIIITLLLSLSALSFQENFSIAAIPQTPTSLPEPGKIRSIAVVYAQTGEFSRFLFAGEDGKVGHWLEVWKLKNTSSANVVNYIMHPRTVITWGRGPVLLNAFNRQCLPRYRPQFDEKDFWVAKINGLELEFVRLENEEDQKIVKGIFSNLQAAATQSRAGGLLDTRTRASVWEMNTISRFQKGQRKWMRPEWVQPLTVCIITPTLN